MRRLRKSDLGRPILIKFYDHCEGEDASPIFTVVYGKLIGYDRQSLRVCAWDTPCDDTTDDSKAEWAILRKVITEAVFLKEDYDA